MNLPAARPESPGTPPGEEAAWRYAAPRELDEALRLLREPGARVLAGGTDLVVPMRDDHLAPGLLVDLGRIRRLRSIGEEGRTVRLGALTTYADLQGDPIILEKVPILAQMAREVGGRQIQNMGTLGGNICNASPAGDSLPPLYALGAQVTLAGAERHRSLPIQDFIQGVRRTARRPDEILVEVSFPAPPARHVHFFTKLGQRDAQAIAIVSLACVGEWARPGSALRRVAIALGAVAPTVVRALRTEAWLAGRDLTDEVLAEAGERAVGECAPIDDLRASAAYRRDMVATLLAAGLAELRDGASR